MIKHVYQIKTLSLCLSDSDSYFRFHHRRKRRRLLTMTVYMNRLFRKSNSSFLLSSGKALKSEVSRFRDDMFLVDAGIGTPKMTMSDELRPIPTNRDVNKFENTVGFMQATAGESIVKTQMLERMFMDLVVGEPDMKERAIARFNDLVGSSEAVAGEPAILLPRRFTQNQAWTELKKNRLSDKKLRGFPVEKVRGGYAVAIAGYIAFLPFRAALARQKLSNDRFTIETIIPKKKKITVC